MQRVVQYVAEDGTPFSDPEECAEYDRKQKFTEELFKFLVDCFPSAEQELLGEMDKLWDVVYTYPERFQSVLDSAKPKPRRGRPRKKRKSATTPTTEEVTHPKDKIAITRKKPPLPSSWRSNDAD